MCKGFVDSTGHCWDDAPVSGRSGVVGQTGPVTGGMPTKPSVPASGYMQGPSTQPQQSGSGLPDWLTKLAGFLPHDADGSIAWSKLGALGLAGYGLYNQSKDQKQANDFMGSEVARRNANDEAVQKNYAAKQGLRDQSMAKLGELSSKKGRFSSYLDK